MHTFHSFVIVWADNLSKLNSIWQATITFVKITVKSVGYDFCGAVKFSNNITLRGFLQWISTRHSPLSEIFMKYTHWSLKCIVSKGCLTTDMPCGFEQRVEWFCLYLEPATWLVHVFAFIPANNVNKSIITYILGCGFPEPTVEHGRP